jgi:hypothetical protein
MRLDSRMSQPKRIEVVEAVYRIMARGNQAQKIYSDDESGVSRAVSFVESSATKEVITMKSKLRNDHVGQMRKV